MTNPEASKRCLYFPGCSQKATSRCYEASLKAICPKLGIQLEEIPDWNCCGTTVAVCFNKTLAHSLSARNLAIAEQMKAGEAPVVTPCPSCMLSLKKAHLAVTEKGTDADHVADALKAGGLAYRGSLKIRHVYEFIVNEIGLDEVKKQVKKPLQGLVVAPYYGCLITRPYADGDDARNPQNLEKLIEALGGKPGGFQLKTACCGGAMMVTKKDQAQKMSGEIWREISAAKADIVVTPCGLCQTNLSVAGRRGFLGIRRSEIPVLNVAQLIGAAFGLSQKELWLEDDIFSIRKSAPLTVLNAACQTR